MNSLASALEALAAGDWHGAHSIVQDDPSPESAWIHAHLHRIEGDEANARYWYRRAGKSFPVVGLDAERAEITAAFGRKPSTD
jgi:hypothetical protein